MSSEVLKYFSGLIRMEITEDQPFRLTSVQAGAAHSWLARRGIAPAYRFTAGEEISIAKLLGNSAIAVQPTVVRPEQVVVPPRRPIAHEIAGPRVGIDIERRENLPQAADYRTHSFYTSHFSAAEISWCISRRDSAESFGGIWAAKEAIRKAFGSDLTDVGLGQIEIGRRDDGAPMYPGASLSVSHTDGLCVAVCVIGSSAAPILETDSSTATSALPPANEKDSSSRVILAAMAISIIALAVSIYSLVPK